LGFGRPDERFFRVCSIASFTRASRKRFATTGVTSTIIALIRIIAIVGIIVATATFMVTLLWLLSALWLLLALMVTLGPISRSLRRVLLHRTKRLFALVCRSYRPSSGATLASFPIR
jgi:fatty acid desaturase